MSDIEIILHAPGVFMLDFTSIWVQKVKCACNFDLQPRAQFWSLLLQCRSFKHFFPFLPISILKFGRSVVDERLNKIHRNVRMLTGATKIFGQKCQKTKDDWGPLGYVCLGLLRLLLCPRVADITYTHQLRITENQNLFICSIRISKNLEWSHVLFLLAAPPSPTLAN